VKRVLGSITNRIFLASTLLAMLSIGAAVYFVSARLTTQTEIELQRDLTEAATLVDDQRRTQFDNFARTATLIADLPKFKAVVEIGDPPTMAPIAVDYLAKAGADLLMVTGRRGEQLALAGETAAHPLTAVNDVALISDGKAAPAFWVHPAGVLEVVSVPITLGLDPPELLGVLSVGYLLDDRRAAQFKALTGAEIAFAMDGVVRASTVGPGAAAALKPLLGSANGTRVSIGTDEYVAMSQALGPHTGPREPTAIILRSRSERMRTLGSIQAALAGIAIGAALLAIAVSYGVARTITRPLASITDHMRHVAATGDLTRKIATNRQGGWDDDDAHMLATTFNTLTDSIARFQREAGQRERLSSLGRLSTVIAHEVRNPLMIIKGALRTMDREGATSADVRDAAKDIDEEIDRLNNLVHDVLDVARPIRFDPAPTDINAICRDAVQAASAGRKNGAVAVSLAPLPELITDSERLRTVLVNLLTNADHAIEGRPGATVSLITTATGDRRVCITIRDTGKGIAEDDLLRIFDPYFTTRRAGTGLGLAIAKNIVEGLGGSIAVATTPGAGTDFRIDLGDAPTRADS
jgi:signal transduction histidine kinase